MPKSRRESIIERWLDVLPVDQDGAMLPSAGKSLLERRLDFIHRFRNISNPSLIAFKKVYGIQWERRGIQEVAASLSCSEAVVRDKVDEVIHQLAEDTYIFNFASHVLPLQEFSDAHPFPSMVPLEGL